MRTSVLLFFVILAVPIVTACDFIEDLLSLGRSPQDATGVEGTVEPTPLHSDDFDGPGSWTPSPRAAITGGAMEVSAGATPMNTWLPSAITDGAFGVTASWRGGDKARTYGLVFRQADSANGYYFLITPSGSYSLTHMNGGVFEELSAWGSDPSVVTGANDRVEVDFCGYRVRCSVNGKELVHAYLDRAFAGQVGLFASEGLAVAFDDAILFDHGRDPDVHGTVTDSGRPMGGVSVRLVSIADPTAMEGRLVSSTTTNGTGRYAFHLPDEGIYLIEAGGSQQDFAAGNGSFGARFVDSLLAEGPVLRDISLITWRGGMK